MPGYVRASMSTSRPIARAVWRLVGGVAAVGGVGCGADCVSVAIMADVKCVFVCDDGVGVLCEVALSTTMTDTDLIRALLSTTDWPT